MKQHRSKPVRLSTRPATRFTLPLAKMRVFGSWVVPVFLGVVLLASSVGATAGARATTTDLVLTMKTSASIDDPNSPLPLVAGEPIYFWLYVQNVGNWPATSVVLQNLLPARAHIFGSYTNGGSCRGTTTITCDLGTLDTNFALSRVIVLAAIADSSGNLTNWASVDMSETDANPLNNVATDTFTVVDAASDPNDTCGITSGPFVTTSSDTAVFEWKTSRLSAATIESFGPNAFGAVTTPRRRNHSATLTGLLADTTYGFKIVYDCAMVTGDVSWRYGAFTTRASTFPQIVSGPVVPVFSMTNLYAVVLLITNKATDLRVQYGTTTAYGQEVYRTAPHQLHAMLLRELQAGTLYHFQIEICDAGDQCTVSNDYSFTTPVNFGFDLNTTPWIISGPAVDSYDVSDTMAVIHWSTDEASTSQVRYGTANGALLNSVSADQLVVDHEIVLDDLQPSTTYYYQASSTNVTGGGIQSGVESFTTKALPDQTGPALMIQARRRAARAQPSTTQIDSNGVEMTYVAEDRLVLDFESDEPATAELVLTPVGTRGIGPSSEIWISFSLSKAHVAEVPDLLNDTDYRYELSLTDASGNTNNYESPQGSTLKTTLDATEPVITNLAVPYEGIDRIMVGWQTDEASDSRIEVYNGGIYSGYYISEMTPVLDHQLDLTRLDEYFTGGETLELRVQSCNPKELCSAWNNVNAQLQITDDIQPPTKLGELTVELGATNLKFFWNTDEPATSEVTLTRQIPGEGAEVVERFDDNLVTNHFINVTGLARETCYTVTIQSTDPAGNPATMVESMEVCTVGSVGGSIGFSGLLILLFSGFLLLAHRRFGQSPGFGARN